MSTRTTERKHHLSGDWTINGLMNQVHPLTHSLLILESDVKHFHIDCGNIEAIDMSGMQLLHVWMELLKMRGVAPKIVNPPDYMQQSIQRLGLWQ